MGLSPKNWTLQNMPRSFSGQAHRLRHPDCPLEILEHYARDSSWDYYWSYYVTQNPRCPSYLLLEIARLGTRVRALSLYNVVRHPNTPLEAYECLLRDSREHVRAAMACSKTTPREILERLSHDRVCLVRSLVYERFPEFFAGRRLEGLSPWFCYPLGVSLSNVSATADELLSFYRKTRELAVKRSILANPNCPVDMLEWAIARTRSFETLAYVLDNPAITVETVLSVYKRAMSLLNRLGTTYYYSLNLLLRIVRHPLCPEEVLLGIALGDYKEATEVALKKLGTAACESVFQQRQAC
ncbi:MAG: hypothetical protein AB1330_01605 [Bacillota bacterium]